MNAEVQLDQIAISLDAAEAAYLVYVLYRFIPYDRVAREVSNRLEKALLVLEGKEDG